MHLKFHPMSLLRAECNRYGCTTVAEAKRLERGDRVRVAAVIAAMKRTVAAGGVMAFLTLEDETGLLEASLLPPAYARFAEVVNTPGPYIIEGKFSRHAMADFLDISRISPFYRRMRPFE